MSPTVLFVDDEVVILKALKEIFSREGFDALTATSGEEALEILERRQVDVLVSDERMPGISGMELLARVKERYPDMIRVVLTAYAELNTMLSAINRVEAHRLIVKPYRNDEIVQTIRDLAKRRARQIEDRRALEAAQREAEFAYAAARILCNPDVPLERKYTELLDLLRRYVRAGALSLMLLDAPARRLVVAAATNPRILGLSRGLDEPAVSAWVARKARTLRVDPAGPPPDRAGWEPHDRTLSPHRGPGFVAVPIHHEGRVVGVFNVADPEDRTLTPGTEQTVSHLMRWVGAMAPAAGAGSAA